MVLEGYVVFFSRLNDPGRRHFPQLLEGAPTTTAASLATPGRPPQIRAVSSLCSRRVYLRPSWWSRALPCTCQLTQVVQPDTQRMFLGAAEVRPGLPAELASRRRRCLRPGVRTTAPSRGPPPPSCARARRTTKRAAPF